MLTERDLDLLSAYIDSTLNPTERAELEARLQTDAELRRELATLRATVDLVKGLPTLRAPRDFTLTPQMVRRPPRILTSAAFSAVSVAAAVMLFVLGSAFLLNSRVPPTNMAGNQVALLATENSPQAPLAAVPLESATNLPELDEAPTVEDGILNAMPVSPQGTFAEPPLAMLATGSAETYAYAEPEAQADGETMGDAAETEMQRSFMATMSATQADAAMAEEMADMASAAMAAPSEPSDDADTGAGAGAAADTSSAFVQQATEQPTEKPTETPTQTPSPTATFTPSPSPTATETPTSVPTATLQPTPIPTPAPVVGFDSIGSSGIGAGLIVLAVLLLGLALVTTILRRRA